MRKAIGSLVAVLAVAGGFGQGGATAAAACAASPSAGGEWRVYGGDYGNTRFQPHETSIGQVQAATLMPAWTFSVADHGGKGDVTATPIVADGCLYVTTTGGWAFALNADTGEVVWGRQLTNSTSVLSGGSYGSPAVTDDRVYVAISTVGSPFLFALDRQTGEVVSSWGDGGKVRLNNAEGSEVYTSPVHYKGQVMLGISGGSAELGEEDERNAFQGSFVLVDVRTAALTRVWIIPEIEQDENQDGVNEHAGGGIWAPAPAIDDAEGVAYVPTGNPFNPRYQHPNTDAILKIGVDPDAPSTFGKILARYRGTVEEYVEAFNDVPCVDMPGNVPPYYPQGAGSCMDFDLDFGAAPNVFTDASGRKIVGAGQKSGIYHAFYPDQVEPGLDGIGEMQAAWRAVVGPPGAIGGITGTSAWDPTSGTIVGPISPAGYLFGVDRHGTQRWLSPVADGAHWAPPVSAANGVAYTVDLKGFLDAYDTRTGAPLLHRPMILSPGKDGTPPPGQIPPLSWGGVAIARNTVYATAGVGALPNGYVIAFRPAALPVLP